jgi:FkbM family methyltransferase
MKQQMTFISYAQNFEDVMLWRALKHIEKGFYVDVGAMDPIVDSVTQAFYERGWRGINIEPARLYYEKLCGSRPLDINLLSAVGDAEGTMKFYEVPETGLSTLDLDTAQTHHESGLTVIEKEVSVVTLNQILAEHVKAPIHFMKIDVEGAEKNVLQGLDLSRWRPWIMVMESTKPNSSEVNYDAWEDLILTAGYDMVYFDGLNRFYVAHEHSVLAEKFRLPPNFWDNFIVDDVYFMRVDRERIQSQLDEVWADREQIRKQLDEVWADREQIRKQLDKVREQLDEVWADREQIRKQLDEVWADRERMYDSLSWRITAPLRAFQGAVRTWRNKLIHLKNRFFSHAVPNFNEIVKKIIWRLANSTTRVLRFVAPGLYARLANNEKLHRIYTRILQAKPTTALISIPPFNRTSHDKLGSTFRQDLQRAVQQWQLGERLDD